MKLMNIGDLKSVSNTTSGCCEKRCILRCDLNLPSSIKDLSRITSIKETVDTILSFGMSIVLISHYKRPSASERFTDKFSLQNVVSDVSNVLRQEIQFCENSVFELEQSMFKKKVMLLENLRFYDGETQNDDVFAQALAKFGDFYINDAFSVSHRSHASVCAITHHLPSFAGLSLQKEVFWLSKLSQEIARPYTAIIGGSKISTKIDVLKQISQIADHLVIAGAMANTFLAASGFDLCESRIERDYFDTALDILATSKAKIILPVDCLASPNIEMAGVVCAIDKIPAGYSCFDIGEKTVQSIVKIMEKSHTLLWNGALGAFEFANFDTSTKILSPVISRLTKASNLVSVIGGGETIASVKEFKDDMTFASTAGGAFLEFVAGNALPGIQSLLRQN
jgi:phosphoglycerate kinase